MKQTDSPNGADASSTPPIPALDGLGAATVACIDDFRWRRVADGRVRVFVRGNLERGETEFAERISGSSADPLTEAGAVLKDASGHFALIAIGPGWVLAAADCVRSIPLFFAEIEGRWVVDDRAERLRRRAGFAVSDVDPDAALAIAMAGYTIGQATLYRGLRALGPGECVVLRAEEPARSLHYHAYRPWCLRPSAPKRLQKDLAETTLDIVARMIASLHGRTLVVPLSAGNDSRLIVSAARHLGYRNVRCFAYGSAEGFEARASKAVAERLGYPWVCVPLTIKGQRRFFESDAYAEYLAYADSCMAVPFVQDMSAIQILKARGFVPGDAVFANGNSGDYISGGHIPPKLRIVPTGMDSGARQARIVDVLSEKHFALWQSLRTPANLARIRSLLWNSIEAAGGRLDAPEADHGLYERAEFQDRQCKYVIGGQRIYDFLGHDWRLPLWDFAYLRFWEGVPLSEKAGQSLYVRMLQAENWGGVWRGIPVNRKAVHPRWLVPVRFAAKLAHAPFGRERWHRTERRIFGYWMDVTCSSACVPYRRVVRDRRGARHAVAWLAESYLSRKDVSIERLGAA